MFKLLKRGFTKVKEDIQVIYDKDPDSSIYDRYTFRFDINTKEILEEVIYTISMSINDNYDVNSVIFNAEDEEIYKSVLKSIE